LTFIEPVAEGARTSALRGGMSACLAYAGGRGTIAAAAL
jgi:hypothetical protein